MFMIIKKKHISFVALTLLCITLLVVSNLSDKKGDANESNKPVQAVLEDSDMPDSGEAIAVVSPGRDFIRDAKTDRDITRSKACELLKETIDNENASEEAKTNAENQLINMATQMDTETECESILSAKGFDKCVVFVSDTSVTVTVVKKDISPEETARINDIIFQQTGNNNIKIVEVK